MTRDPFIKRRQIKVVFGVLAVAIVMSALVAMALVFMGQTHPRF